MRLRQSFGTPMHALSRQRDVHALVDYITNDWRFFADTALVIRDNYDQNPPSLENALEGAQISLWRFFPSTPMFPEEIMRWTILIRDLYTNAHNDKDTNNKRAKILEMLVYHLIKGEYEPHECLMNALVDSRRNARVPVTQGEIDVCAWREADKVGEAYECKIRPAGLTANDAENLLCIEAECAPYATWFQMGVASFEGSAEMKKKLRVLARQNDFGKAFEDIKAYGIDNFKSILG